MTAFQRDALQDFVLRGDKSPPPVFVGRDEILKTILSLTELTGRDGRAPPGNTRIIQGAPGAGKSSILRELVTRTNQMDTSRTVVISNIELQQSLPDVVQALAFAGSTTPETWRRTLSRYGDSWVQRIDQISAFGLGVRLTDTPPPTAPQDLMSLKTQVPADMWQRPVIVAVDEAQRLPPGTDTAAALFLQAVHDAATSLPLTLVCAGLGDTQSRLRDLGLTHGIRAHSLGCLTPAESTTLLDRFCAHFGMTMERCRGRARAVMDTTDGWPRHVHWAQQALAEAVLEPDINGDLDRITDWDRVQARSDTLRHGYYATQFSQDMAAARKLVGRVMFAVGTAQAEGKGLRIDEIHQTIKTLSDHNATGDYDLPEGVSPQSFVTHLIHCGALQDDPDTGHLTCPIPSFQRYIITRGGLDPDQLPAPPAA